MTLSTTSLRREPEARRHLAVDVELDAGVIEVLGDQNVAHALSPRIFRAISAAVW